MFKAYRSMIIWGLAALVCIAALTMQSQADEFKMGPGDRYDESGNIVSYDGTLLVRSDGTVIEYPFESNNGGASAAQSAVTTAAQAAATAAQTAATTAAQAAITAVPAEVKEQISNYTAAVTSDGTAYSFEGKKYVKSSLYGTRKLTGYSGEEDGYYSTYSGNTARSAHTVSAPSDLPIGTVIIIEGESGPYASEYNGVYVVEDRGGYALESNGLIDIYFDTSAAAAHVTDYGWNYANIWIAKSAE
ncbi:MAG: hypothetical protein Q4E57_00660 [Eubacteriales bacterium]|nr:hypothetical protein [Eubacteriales bacterium]